MANLPSPSFDSPTPESARFHIQTLLDEPASARSTATFRRPLWVTTTGRAFQKRAWAVLAQHPFSEMDAYHRWWQADFTVAPNRTTWDADFTRALWRWYWDRTRVHGDDAAREEVGRAIERVEEEGRVNREALRVAAAMVAMDMGLLPSSIDLTVDLPIQLSDDLAMPPWRRSAPASTVGAETVGTDFIVWDASGRRYLRDVFPRAATPGLPPPTTPTTPLTRPVSPDAPPPPPPAPRTPPLPIPGTLLPPELRPSADQVSTAMNVGTILALAVAAILVLSGVVLLVAPESEAP